MGCKETWWKNREAPLLYTWAVISISLQEQTRGQSKKISNRVRSKATDLTKSNQNFTNTDKNIHFYKYNNKIMIYDSCKIFRHQNWYLHIINQKQITRHCKMFWTYFRLTLVTLIHILCIYWGNGFHAAGSTQLLLSGDIQIIIYPSHSLCILILTLHNAILCSSADETRSGYKIYDADIVLKLL